MEPRSGVFDVMPTGENSNARIRDHQCPALSIFDYTSKTDRAPSSLVMVKREKLNLCPNWTVFKIRKRDGAGTSKLVAPLLESRSQLMDSLPRVTEQGACPAGRELPRLEPLLDPRRSNRPTWSERHLELVEFTRSHAREHVRQLRLARISKTDVCRRCRRERLHIPIGHRRQIDVELVAVVIQTDTSAGSAVELLAYHRVLEASGHVGRR